MCVINRLSGYMWPTFIWWMVMIHGGEFKLPTSILGGILGQVLLIYLWIVTVSRGGVGLCLQRNDTSGRHK